MKHLVVNTNANTNTNTNRSSNASAFTNYSKYSRPAAKQRRGVWEERFPEDEQESDYQQKKQKPADQWNSWDCLGDACSFTEAWTDFDFQWSDAMASLSPKKKPTNTPSTQCSDDGFSPEALSKKFTFNSNRPLVEDDDETAEDYPKAKEDSPVQQQQKHTGLPFSEKKSSFQNLFQRNRSNASNQSNTTASSSTTVQERQAPPVPASPQRSDLVASSNAENANESKKNKKKGIRGWKWFGKKQTKQQPPQEMIQSTKLPLEDFINMTKNSPSEPMVMMEPKPNYTFQQLNKTNIVSSNKSIFTSESSQSSALMGLQHLEDQQSTRSSSKFSMAYSMDGSSVGGLDRSSSKFNMAYSADGSSIGFKQNPSTEDRSVYTSDTTSSALGGMRFLDDESSAASGMSLGIKYPSHLKIKTTT